MTTPTRVEADHAIRASARERGRRTLWQGLALDVAVAIAAALLAWLPESDVLDRAAWLILATSVIKTVLQAVASYVLRLKLAPTEESPVIDGAYVITEVPHAAPVAERIIPGHPTE